MAVATKQHVLSDDILARCAERAPIYDRENRFFNEDFEELRQAGYLRMNVPKSSVVWACRLAAGLPGAAPPRLPRRAHRPGSEYASVLDGRGRRPLACRRQVPGMAPEGRCGR